MNVLLEGLFNCGACMSTLYLHVVVVVSMSTCSTPLYQAIQNGELALAEDPNCWINIKVWLSKLKKEILHCILR